MSSLLLSALALLGSCLLPERPVSPTPDAAHAGLAAQDPQAGGADEGPRKPNKTKPARDCSPEYTTLENAWRGAFQDYSGQRLAYDRANATVPLERRDPSKRPVHPAAAWWARFEALGRQGDPDALLWLVEQAQHAFPEVERQAASAEKAFGELLERVPDHRTIEVALESLLQQYEVLGRERLLALAERAADAGTNAENQARALLVKAWATTERFKSTDPGRLRQGEQAFDAVLLGYPRTRAAREASGHVFPRLKKELLAAEFAWTERVRALQDSKADPKEWPAQPVHAWHEKLLALAAAGSPEAGYVVKHSYPAYQQAEGNGIGFGLLYLSIYFSERMGHDPEGWTRARLGLLEIVTRQFADQPLTMSLLIHLLRGPQGLPRKYLEPVLAPVLESKTAPARSHALAMFLQARAEIAAGRSADWIAARARLEELLRLHPEEEVAAMALENLKQLQNVWPGTRAPDFRGTDQDGRAFKLEDYRGHVAVVEFFGKAGGAGPDDIARRIGLIEELEGRPFRWLGACVDAAAPRDFRASHGAAGVNWRCALLGTVDSDIGALWVVSTVPTTFVVDAEGVIRGRNLPWDEQRELIGKLIAEAEARREKH